MLDILDALFAPFARMLVARGIPFADLTERMKAHYVQAARRQAEAEGKATDSRLSVMTGLQRREIARLKDFAPRDERPNHLARLIALWRTAPGYQDGGAPRDLPKNGAEPSFEDLARQVRRDVHARTMLDALEAAGAVVVTDQTVRLLATSYQPLAGSDDQIAYLARNLGDHMAAATDNVLADAPPHFERAVHYSGLDAEAVAELDAEYRKGQMALFEAISRRAEAMKAAGRTGSTRFRAAGYFYAVDQEED